MTAVELASDNTHLAAVGDWLAEATVLASESRCERTWAEYRKEWRVWATWYQAQSVAALPATPATVAEFVAAQAAEGRRSATIEKRLAAVSVYHDLAGHDSPTRDRQVRQVMAGVRRRLGTAQRRVQPVTVPVLTRMVMALDTASNAGLRDRVALLVGFAAALRRVQLAALTLDDLTASDEGLRLRIRRSKTDQEGKGVTLSVPHGSSADLCPVRAVDAWRQRRDRLGVTCDRLVLPVTRYDEVEDRPIGGKAIAMLVKRAASRAGLDSAEFSGHSLRAGLVTAAAQAGVAEADIARTSRHKSIPVLRTYVREADVFRRNAAGAVL